SLYQCATNIRILSRSWSVGFANERRSLPVRPGDGCRRHHGPMLGGFRPLPSTHPGVRRPHSGREILAYITAVWMIVSGLAVLWRYGMRVGGAALAVIYFIFAVFWLPRLYTAPLILGFRIPILLGVLAGVATQLIVAAAGEL